MNDQFSSEVKEWIKISSWLKSAKEREAELREKIVKELFGSPATAGTFVKEFEGFQFKLRQDENLELDQDKVAALSSRMTEVAFEQGITITEPIFRWKASIDKRAYAIFPEPLKRVLNEGVTLKYGMPSLSVAPIVEPVEAPPVFVEFYERVKETAAADKARNVLIQPKPEPPVANNQASTKAALAIKQQMALNEAIGATQIKRRRGRPAGSKNKAKE